MKNIDKNVWIVLGVVAVLLIVIFARANKAPTDDTLPTSDQTGVQDTSTIPANPSVKIPSVSISYADALLKYKDSRIQLGLDCQASPNTLTFKNDTNIMIDNRSNVSKTVKVGTTMTIKPWGFRIVNIKSSTLPATWLVDCGSSQNVATILIQN